MQLAERPAGNGEEDTKKKKMSPQLQATGKITINLSVTHTHNCMSIHTQYPLHRLWFWWSTSGRLW